jgi:hypothetical protein
MQEKKGNGKSKKDTRKWCEFHNIPWNNTDECRSIQSLVSELKDKESNPNSDPDSENNKRRQIMLRTKYQYSIEKIQKKFSTP